MSRTSRRVVGAVLLAASAVLLFHFFRNADLDRAGALLVRAGPMAPLLLLPAFLGILLQTAGWSLIVDFLSHRVSLVRLALIRLASEAVFLTAPAGTAAADGVTLHLLARQAGVPVPDGVAAVAARRMLLFAGNGVYLLLAFALGYSDLVRASRQVGAGTLLAWLPLVAASALLGTAALASSVIFSGSLAGRVQRALARLPWKRARVWLGERAARFVETDRRLRRLAAIPPRRLGLSLAGFVAAWLMDAVETFIALRFVGASLGFGQALSLEVLVSLLRSFAFVLPGAIGVQDAGYVALLGAFGVADPATTGIAFLVVKRAREMVVVALGYVLLALPARASAASRSFT